MQKNIFRIIHGCKFRWRNKIWDVLKYKTPAFFWNLCDSCMSVCVLLLLSRMHSLGLGLDLGNSLHQREESACSYTSRRASKKRRLILSNTWNLLVSHWNFIDSFMLFQMEWKTVKKCWDLTLYCNLLCKLFEWHYLIIFDHFEEI